MRAHCVGSAMIDVVLVSDPSVELTAPHPTCVEIFSAWICRLSRSRNDDVVWSIVTPQPIDGARSRNGGF
jgi:hypothetical protein